MPVIKIHLEHEELSAIKRRASELGISVEDLAYGALNCSMSHVKESFCRTRIDQAVERTRPRPAPVERQRKVRRHLREQARHPAGPRPQGRTALAAPRAASLLRRAPEIRPTRGSARPHPLAMSPRPVAACQLRSASSCRPASRASLPGAELAARRRARLPCRPGRRPTAPTIRWASAGASSPGASHGSGTPPRRRGTARRGIGGTRARESGQPAVDTMLSRSLRALSGKADDRAAHGRPYSAYFNRQQRQIEAGYRSGEKVAVKINCNNAYGGYGDVDGQIDQSPQVLLGLVRQLVTIAGVPQEMITVYEAARVVPDRVYLRRMPRSRASGLSIRRATARTAASRWITWRRCSTIPCPTQRSAGTCRGASSRRRTWST